MSLTMQYELYPVAHAVLVGGYVTPFTVPPTFKFRVNLFKSIYFTVSQVLNFRLYESENFFSYNFIISTKNN